MPEIRPIKDLRNTNEISELCHERNEPIYNTKNGYGHLVVMSMETYKISESRYI
jgi:PHD/YefM family antitoxin component YafN of YafNO toxin-antitoxin module